MNQAPQSIEPDPGIKAIVESPSEDSRYHSLEALAGNPPEALLHLIEKPKYEWQTKRWELKRVLLHGTYEERSDLMSKIFKNTLDYARINNEERTVATLEYERDLDNCYKALSRLIHKPRTCADAVNES